MNLDLSIIIVNYHSAEDILNCIQSIVESTHNLSYEVIVVDNSSSTKDRSQIIANFDFVKWFDIGYNSGFSRANNLGIKNSIGNFILILNPDTLLYDNVLYECVQKIKSDKKLIACGVQLLNPDNSNQFSGAYFKIGGFNTLLPLPVIGKVVKSLGLILKTKIPSVFQIKDEVEVDWISGAFILVRSKIRELNILFDEDFFMYSEEIEWCNRLGKIGNLKLFNIPSVVHIGGTSSQNYYSNKYSSNSTILWDKKGKQIMLSNFLRIRKQFGLVWFGIIIMFYIVEAPLFFIASILMIFSQKEHPFKIQYARKYLSNLIHISHFYPKILLNQACFYKI